MASFTYQSSNSTHYKRTNQPSFFRKYWFECLILTGLCYLMMCRDVHLTIGYHAPDSTISNQQILSESGNWSSLGILTSHSSAAPPEAIFDLFAAGTVPANLSTADQARLLQCQTFIERFAKVAIAEKNKFGIPASITLAQALLASKAGEMPMVAAGNNFFGLACTSDQNCIEVDGLQVASYSNPWESFRAHSLLLSSEKYSSLSRYRQVDYKAWAGGLVEAGYYPDKDYADQLVQIIEALDLYLFDSGI